MTTLTENDIAECLATWTAWRAAHPDMRHAHKRTVARNRNGKYATLSVVTAQDGTETVEGQPPPWRSKPPTNR